MKQESQKNSSEISESEIQKVRELIINELQKEAGLISESELKLAGREFLNSEKVQEILERKILNRLESGHKVGDQHLQLINPERLQVAVEGKVLEKLNKGIPVGIQYKNFIDSNFLKSKEVVEATKNGIIHELELGRKIPKQLVDLVNPKFLMSKEVKDAVQKGLIFILEMDRKTPEENNELILALGLHKFENWKDYISLRIAESDFKDFVILSRLLESKIFQGYENSLWDKILKSSANGIYLYEKFNELKQKLNMTSTYKCMRIFCAFLSERNVNYPGLWINDYMDEIFLLIDSNPGIISVISAGDRYSHKLLEVFESFDKHAKDAFKALFENGMFEGRDLYDQDTRKSQISSLTSFGINKEFLNSMSKDSPEKLKNWLFYPKQREFLLGGEKTELVSEKIRVPVNRLVFESSKTIYGAIRSLTLNFKQTDTIPLSKDESYIELEAKITKLETEIENSVDPEKKVKMQKGLDSLKKQKEKYKPKQASGYFNGIVDSLNILGDKIQKDINKLDDLKKQESNKSQVKSIKTLDFNIASDLNVFMLRLHGLIISMQEKEGVSFDAELLNHIVNDIGEINATIDSETRPNNKLEGRKIAIGICNRNPNISLFLGNYTNCCVSIEDPNDIHENEPPILDYLTDLGMQLVVASDTTDPKNPIPVAVAWTYIGEGGRMVIDNIEANSEYTGSFPGLFSEEIKNYMEEYASTCDMKLIQGDQNNDLVVAPLMPYSVNKTYYNRADGYYLEAE